MRQRMTKDDLLKHYTRREPTVFQQFDGWAGRWLNDCAISADGDSDSITAGVTSELMAGSDVRVLILVLCSRTDALRLLEKITSFVRRTPDEGWSNVLIPPHNAIPF